jgi:phosphohistidine phosphatase
MRLYIASPAVLLERLSRARITLEIDPMKLLGLFRHAKSGWQDPRARDFDRPLNERGRKGAALMGRHIRDHGVHWDRAIASPAVRVGETIELAAEAAGRSLAVNWDRRIYLASSATLMDLLRIIRDWRI